MSKSRAVRSGSQSESGREKPLTPGRGVFISHATDEAPLADAVACFLKNYLPDVDTVVSSRLSAGVDWYEHVTSGLRGSRTMIILCSPTSLTRPWLNLEFGFFWGRELPIIPVYHSGLDCKRNLPQLPYSRVGALDLQDETFPARLLQSVCEHLKIVPAPSIPAGSAPNDHEAMLRARDLISSTGPDVILGLPGRTDAIIADLSKLLRSGDLKKKVVWTTGFLTAFAIGPKDPCLPDQQSHSEQLLQERELLVELARRGCNVRCVISPVNKNNFRRGGINFAIARTTQLIEFLTSGDKALQNIDWAVSPAPAKNLYIIDKVSCFEGFERDARRGFELTIRQTIDAVIQGNADICDAWIRDLQERIPAKLRPKVKSGDARERLRIATTNCLRESLDYLKRRRRGATSRRAAPSASP